MDYLFASASLGPLSQLFSEIIGAVGGADRIGVYRDVEGLSARLRRQNRPGILILILANAHDLTAIHAHAERLVDANLVLLVADSDRETMAKAHALRPSYLGTTDGDLDNVVPVLQRLLAKRTRLNQKPERSE